MNESTLWKHLRPELALLGHFQKISDRFTPGIPDILGMHDGNGYAWELKELKGVRVLRTKFRPGQLDWLRDWEQAGGTSSIISTNFQRVYVHSWEDGKRLEAGCLTSEIDDGALLVWDKTRKNSWAEFCKLILTVTI